MITTTINSSNLQDRIASVRGRIVKIIDQDLTLAAKRTAYYSMEYTLPLSNAGNEWPVAPMQSRILSDVKKAYPSIGDQGWESGAYKIIEDVYGKDRANEFFHTFMSRETTEKFDPETGEYTANPTGSAEEMVANMRKLPRKIDDKGYADLLRSKAIKSKKGRRLPKGTRPLAIVRSGAGERFARKRQKRAGLAKSAWYQAAFRLGGQVNYRSSKFEAGRFEWPRECGQLHKLNPGIGSATKTVDSGGGVITLRSNLRYASEAMEPWMKETACRLSQNAMRILFEKRLKAKETWENRKGAVAA